jgi:hypothetical protein
MLCKASSGRIFGSFSMGLQRKTFIFSLSEDCSNLNCFYQKSAESKTASVKVAYVKFLIYGSDELRIKLTEMKDFSVSLVSKGDEYYEKIDWKQIIGDKIGETNGEGITYS